MLSCYHVEARFTHSQKVVMFSWKEINFNLIWPCKTPAISCLKQKQIIQTNNSVDQAKDNDQGSSLGLKIIVGVPCFVSFVSLVFLHISPIDHEWPNPVWEVSDAVTDGLRISGIETKCVNDHSPPPGIEPITGPGGQTRLPTFDWSQTKLLLSRVNTKLGSSCPGPAAELTNFGCHFLYWCRRFVPNFHWCL